MLHLNITRRGAAVAFMSTALLAGCAQQDGPLTPTRGMRSGGPSLDVGADAPQGVLNLAKYSVVPGTYTFNITVSGGGEYLLPGGATRTMVLDEVQMSVGGVVTAYTPQNPASWMPGQTAKVTITETNIPVGLRVDSVQVWFNGHLQATTVATNSGSVNTGYSDTFWIIFFNGAIPQQPPVYEIGYSACPVGFWKKNKNVGTWAGSGLTTTQLVGSLFAATAQYTLKGKPLSQLSLLDGLKAKGDGALIGAAEKLIRTGIAAELNARRSGWNYPMTPSAITDAVNNTLATRDKKKIRQMASVFRQMNKSNKGNVDPDDDDDDDDPAVSCPLRG